MLSINRCSAGIGNALAREFHANGCHVIASARRKETLTSLQELGMDTISLDVCDEASVKNAKLAVEKLVGEKGLDILVNNALVSLLQTIKEC